MLRSLRFKILFFLILANSLSFIAMNLINYEISNKQMNRQLEKSSFTELKNAIAGLETMLSLRLNEAALLGRSDWMKLGSEEDKLRSLDAAVRKLPPPYLYGGLADAAGNLRLTDGTSVDVGAMSAFKQAAGGVAAISDPVLGREDKPIVWLFNPVPDAASGQVLAIALDSNEALGQILRIESSSYTDNAIVLVNSNTDLLYSGSRGSEALKLNYLRDQPGLASNVERMLANAEGSSEGEVFGRKLKLFHVKVPGFDWYAIYSVSKKEFEAPLRESLWINMGLIALTETIVGAFLFVFTRKYILARLKQLLTVTRKVASGDFYAAPIPVESQDELGQLAFSVNAMAENIRDLFEPFNSFIDHNKYAMIVADSQYRITSFNALAETMLGYKADEVVGTRSLLLWQDENQLRERANEYSNRLNRNVPADESALFETSLSGIVPDWEWQWIARDGKRLLASVNPSVIRHPDGTIKGYVLIARDISDIKIAAETNARLHDIMESAHDMIASFDLRGRIFYLNQSGKEFLGIPSLGEENNRLSSYMTIPTTIKLAEGLAEAQKAGYWQSELEFVRASGETNDASITVVAHASDDGGETFFSTIVRDISERKEIERQLVHAKVQADEASDAKSTFLARMSHEIRTPLNGIIGLTYLLQRSELSDLQQDYLRQVSHSSHNLLRLLNDVLDFSKLEADKLTLEMAPFRLEDSLQRVSSLFSVLLGPKPVDFIVHANHNVPASFVGDYNRIEQVLLNLGSNAIKFTNVGMIVLRVELLERKGGEARLRFTVRDTGIGMTKEQIDQLFVPFVQADNKISRKYGGTGLGLVITQALVDRMGGTLEVDSVYREGSRFAVELTLAIEEGAGTNADLPKLSRKAVILEDHPVVSEHWRSLLASFGCEAVTASSWEAALGRLREGGWDLFVADMEAGDMHGEETWDVWKNELDALGVQAVCYTTLLGRDALQHLPDDRKPAAVLIKPSSTLLVHQTLSHLSGTKPKPKPVIRKEPELSMEDRPPLGRILVVDDQQINRLIAKQLLEQQGFEVEQADGGPAAIRALKNGRFDLVLMDLHMPEQDGAETTAIIRREFDAERLPIVALTADTTREQHARCLEAGMNAVVTKPIQPDILFSTLSRWFEAAAGVSPASAAGPTESEPEIASYSTRVLDVRLALSRLDGKTKLYNQLLRKFNEQYADFPDRFAELIEDGNRAEAIRLVHSISGAAGHLGALSLQETAAALEAGLKAGEESASYARRFNESLSETIGEMNAIVRKKPLDERSST